MEIKYYIYEVKGIKNGCTNQWDKRSEQNFKRYNIMPVIIETHEYPNTAEYWQIVGDREWELAELNGYPKGVHYRVARERAIVGAKNTSPNGGKIGGKISGKLRRKLTYEDAQTIRELYLNKKQYNQKQLAEMYDIDQSAISFIINNKSYINQ
jgi:hypothetical protein